MTSSALLSRLREVDLSTIDGPNKTEFVYVLVNEGRIVYIGRTVELMPRLAAHRFGTTRHEPKAFDRAFSIEVPTGDVSAIEGALIRRFNPELCTGAPSDESRDVEMLARFGLEPDPAARDAFVQRRSDVFVRSHEQRKARKAPRGGAP